MQIGPDQIRPNPQSPVALQFRNAASGGAEFAAEMQGQHSPGRMAPQGPAQEDSDAATTGQSQVAKEIDDMSADLEKGLPEGDDASDPDSASSTKTGIACQIHGPTTPSKTSGPGRTSPDGIVQNSPISQDILAPIDDRNSWPRRQNSEGHLDDAAAPTDTIHPRSQNGGGASMDRRDFAGRPADDRAGSSSGGGPSGGGAGLASLQSAAPGTPGLPSQAAPSDSLAPGPGQVTRPVLPADQTGEDLPPLSATRPDGPPFSGNVRAFPQRPGQAGPGRQTDVERGSPSVATSLPGHPRIRGDMAQEGSGHIAPAPLPQTPPQDGAGHAPHSHAAVSNDPEQGIPIATLSHAPPADQLAQHRPIHPGQTQQPWQQTAAAIALVAQGDALSTTELILAPEELGKLRLEIVTQDDRLTIRLFAERPDTLDLLRRQGDLLLAELRQAGFAQSSLSFGDWGQNRQPPGALASLGQLGPENTAPAFAAPSPDPAPPFVAGRLHIRL